MNTTKRIILTGATGLVGRKLFAALRERGYALVIFSRNPDSALLEGLALPVDAVFDAN